MLSPVTSNRPMDFASRGVTELKKGVISINEESIHLCGDGSVGVPNPNPMILLCITVAADLSFLTSSPRPILEFDEFCFSRSISDAEERDYPNNK